MGGGGGSGGELCRDMFVAEVLGRGVPRGSREDRTEAASCRWVLEDGNIDQLLSGFNPYPRQHTVGLEPTSGNDTLREKALR